MKLYVPNPVCSCCALVRVVADLVGQNLEVVVVDKNSAEMKAKNFLAQYPMLETADGLLYESTAICVYLAQLSGKGLGSSPVDRALVDQWIAYSNTTLLPCVEKVETGIFGTGPIF
jgi:glutathione S-transferase